MKRLQHTYLLGLVTATLLIGCGGDNSATGSSGANQPSSDINTQSTSGGTTSSQPSSDAGITSTSGATVQCKQIDPVLKTLNKKYATSKDDYNSYNLSDTISKNFKGSSDGKGSRDGGSKGSSDEKGSSGGGSKGSSDEKGSSGGGSKGSSDGGKGSNDSGGLHNEGRNCLSCHSFKSAGTVFTSLNARNNTPGAAGYRIQLNDNIVFASARGTGNSRSSSFPSGKFTAHVIDPNGNIVNSSANMSHDASRRACNSCHSSSGNNGAPGRITSLKLSSSVATPVGASTSACVSFSSNVMPILEAKCKSCHGSNGNFKVTTPNATYSNINALKGSSTAGGKYLLDKGSNSIGHGGGQVISVSSGEYTTLKAWVSESAPNN